MDARIDFYLQRLKGIGHHFGHDPRTHGHRDLRRELREEEEEDEGVEEEQQQRRGRQDRERRSQVRPLIAAQRRPGQAARDYLASHEQDLVAFDEEEGLDGAQEGEEEEIPESQRRHKRHRADLDAQRQRGIRETQAKRARVLDRASGVEAGRGGASPAREEDTDAEDSEEIEGSDLFGDRTYDDDEPGFDFNAQEYVFISFKYTRFDELMSLMLTELVFQSHFPQEPVRFLNRMAHLSLRKQPWLLRLALVKRNILQPRPLYQRKGLRLHFGRPPH